MFPQEVAKLLQGVEIVIVSMSTRPYYMASLSQEFFNYMFAENLAVNCRHVVIRITKDDDPKERGHQDFGRRHHWSRSGGRVDVEKVLKMYGMEKERIKAKMCKWMY